jgi:hypothetical protein
MSRFALQAIQINDTEYAGCTGETFDRGFTVTTMNSDGVAQETVQLVEHEAASAEITAWSIKTLLGILGTSGTNIFPMLALDGTNGVQMIGAKAATNAPAFAGSSVHMSRQAINGVIYMSGLRWSLKQKAEMTLKALFVGTGDGVTAAVAASTVALPTQVDPTEGWTLSALTINGAVVVSVNSVDLSINPKFEYEYSAGLPVPISLSGAGARGPVEIRLTADIGDATLANGTGSVVLVFTQYAVGGGLAAHTVTITLNGNFSFENTVGGQGGSPLSKRLTVIPTSNNSSTFAMTWAET